MFVIDLWIGSLIINVRSKPLDRLPTWVDGLFLYILTFIQMAKPLYRIDQFVILLDVDSDSRYMGKIVSANEFNGEWNYEIKVGDNEYDSIRDSDINELI